MTSEIKVKGARQVLIPAVPELLPSEEVEDAVAATPAVASSVILTIVIQLCHRDKGGILVSNKREPSL